MYLNNIKIILKITLKECYMSSSMFSMFWLKEAYLEPSLTSMTELFLQKLLTA